MLISEEISRGTEMKRCMQLGKLLGLLTWILGRDWCRIRVCECESMEKRQSMEKRRESMDNEDRHGFDGGVERRESME
ncbi:hypothetical protein TB1_044741 [Malus domestica]